MSSRLLKELKNLSPWQWDSKPLTVGPKTLKDFEKVEECLSNRSTSRTRQPPLSRRTSMDTPGPNSLPKPCRLLHSHGKDSDPHQDSHDDRPGSSIRRPQHFNTPSSRQHGSGGHPPSSQRVRPHPMSDTRPLPAPQFASPSSAARRPQEQQQQQPVPPASTFRPGTLPRTNASGAHAPPDLGNVTPGPRALQLFHQSGTPSCGSRAAPARALSGSVGTPVHTAGMQHSPAPPMASLAEQQLPSEAVPAAAAAAPATHGNASDAMDVDQRTTSLGGSATGAAASHERASVPATIGIQQTSHHGPMSLQINAAMDCCDEVATSCGDPEDPLGHLPAPLPSADFPEPPSSSSSRSPSPSPLRKLRGRPRSQESRGGQQGPCYLEGPPSQIQIHLATSNRLIVVVGQQPQHEEAPSLAAAAPSPAPSGTSKLRDADAHKAPATAAAASPKHHTSMRLGAGAASFRGRTLSCSGGAVPHTSTDQVAHQQPQQQQQAPSATATKQWISADPPGLQPYAPSAQRSQFCSANHDVSGWASRCSLATSSETSRLGDGGGSCSLYGGATATEAASDAAGPSGRALAAQREGTQRNTDAAAAAAAAAGGTPRLAAGQQQPDDGPAPSPDDPQDRLRRWWQAAGGVLSPAAAPATGPARAAPSASPASRPAARLPSPRPAASAPSAASVPRVSPASAIPVIPAPRAQAASAQPPAASLLVQAAPPGPHETRALPSGVHVQDPSMPSGLSGPHELSEAASQGPLSFNAIVKEVARVCHASSAPPTQANIHTAVMWVQMLRNPAATPLQRMAMLRQLQLGQEPQPQHLGMAQQKEGSAPPPAAAYEATMAPTVQAALEIEPLHIANKAVISEGWDTLVPPAMTELLHALLTGVKSLQGAMLCASGGGRAAGCASETGPSPPGFQLHGQVAGAAGGGLRSSFPSAQNLPGMPAGMLPMMQAAVASSGNPFALMQSLHRQQQHQQMAAFGAVGNFTGQPMAMPHGMWPFPLSGQLPAATNLNSNGPTWPSVPPTATAAKHAAAGKKQAGTVKRRATTGGHAMEPAADAFPGFMSDDGAAGGTAAGGGGTPTLGGSKKPRARSKRVAVSGARKIEAASHLLFSGCDPHHQQMLHAPAPVDMAADADPKPAREARPLVSLQRTLTLSDGLPDLTAAAAAAPPPHTPASLKACAWLLGPAAASVVAGGSAPRTSNSTAPLAASMAQRIPANGHQTDMNVLRALSANTGRQHAPQLAAPAAGAGKRGLPPATPAPQHAPPASSPAFAEAASRGCGKNASTGHFASHQQLLMGSNEPAPACCPVEVAGAWGEAGMAQHASGDGKGFHWKKSRLL